MTKELQEFVFLLRTDFGTYHEGPAWHICAQGDCPRVIDCFHALGFGPFHILSHLGLGPLLLCYYGFVALIFIDNVHLRVMQ
jgi:hypothetical protein